MHTFCCLFCFCLCFCLCLCLSYPHSTHDHKQHTHTHTHHYTQWGIIDNASSFTPPTDGGGGWTQVPVNATMPTMHGLGGWASLTLDPTTGGIVGLASSRSNQTWATPSNPLGVLTYQSLTEDDYKGWRKDYLAVDCDTEYGKPNQQSAVPTPVHQLVSPTITALWRHAGGPTGDDAVLLHMSFPHDLVSDYGAPAAAELRLTFPSRMSPVQVRNNLFTPL